MAKTKKILVAVAVFGLLAALAGCRSKTGKDGVTEASHNASPGGASVPTAAVEVTQNQDNSGCCE